ncbi:MAG: MBL fold metallo-hydrolase, partial [Ruminococcaceae bacterium]|nr:MBL fold metallo-hydrolase [Oscillospiraceae bacterium]
MRKRVVTRIVSLLLTAIMLLSFAPMSVVAAPSIKTDADFFAKLDLDTTGLEDVKAAVSAGNYTTAKSALLTYYKNKFAGYAPNCAGMGRYFGTLAMLDTFAYPEAPVANKTISGSSYQQYSLGVVSDTSGCYVLSTLKKTSYSVEICSKEYATASMRPVLKCYNSAGTLLASVNPSADATVKYGSKSTNYGTATTLVARHDSTTSLPYSTNSQRAYLKFTVPSGTAKTELVIYAKINGSSSASLDLWQFSAVGTAWTETNLTWQWLIDNSSVGHYSYDGVTGGFDWKAAEGVPAHSWIDMNCRLHCVHALFQTALDSNTSAADKERYLNKGKELLFDFINDADVTIGWYDGRDKESGYRLNYAPFFYKTLLENEKLTADENVTFLKYIFDEIEFLDGGGNLFSNTSTSHASSAYTNHAFHHISGFYSGLSYFSEFANKSTWTTRYADRWNDLINDIGLLGTDGSYNEGLLGGYTSEVMECICYIATAMKDTGDTTSASSKLYTSYMIKFVRFMMDMTFPNNITPATGQHGSVATKEFISEFLSALSHDFYDDQDVQELKYFLNSDDGIAPETHAYYPVGQFATDRTGYTTSDSMIYMSARAGGHYDHPDALAILYYNNGRYLLAETATNANTTAAHNTIECNGTNQRTNLKQMTYKDNSTLSSAGNQGASSMSAWTSITEGFHHYREVSWFKALNGIMIVTDKAQYGNGTSTTKYSYVQNWHTSSGSNSSVASDSYDTGKTAFSSGSNLIIAQASGNSITAAVSGNNFKYTQSVAGAATYQTVLYPVKAGATVTVRPNKITLDVADSVARASQINITDSANTDLKTLYFYQSFESAPASRAFGSFTTDASNAAVAQNASSVRNFASLTNGSAITVSGVPVLKTSAAVTDISATLNGTTLEIESSDADIANMTVSVNFAGATVSKVTLNGEEVPFSTDSASTVMIGQKIIHFYGDAAGELSNWTVNQANLTSDTANSVINGTASGGDPYFFNKSSLDHTIKSGDIVEIRLKTTVDSTDIPNAYIYFRTSDGGSFGGNGVIHGIRTSTYVDGEFSTLRFTFPTKNVGQTITSLRIDPFAGDSIIGKTFSLDYIYIGAPSKAPSTYVGSLLFDFKNDAESYLRYTCEAYGDHNFNSDEHSSSALSTAGVWYMNGNQTSDIAISGDAISVTHKPNTGYWGYISTANCLKYYTNPGDIIQVKLKTLNMETVPGKSLALRFYANNSTADLANTTSPLFPLPTAFEDDTYYVLQTDLSDAMIAADYLTSARIQWSNLQNIEGKTGKLVIDYIYIGPAANAPESKSSYQIRYSDGLNLLTALDTDIPTSTVNGGDNTSTYSISNRIVTIQNKKTSGETFHYFNRSGDEFYLTAGQEYRFSCTTSGVWGSQVEAFLRTGSTHIRMNSNNFTFTPTITGTYHLRFDVNVAGETHAFENVRIDDAETTLTTHGSTAPSTHYFAEAKTLSKNGYERPGYTFAGWSATKGATAATYTDAQSVTNITNTPGATVVLYAVWVKDSYPSTYLYQLPSRRLDGSVYSQNMSYVIKTRSGKIIVIDGGYETEDGDAEYLLSFLRKITGKSVPNVDAWFFTHPHADHIGAFEGLAKRHAGEITVDTIYYNFPSREQIIKYSPESSVNGMINAIKDFESLIPNIKRADGSAIKVVEILARHQNQCRGSFAIDTVNFDILLTCEDVFAAADSDTTLYSGTLETNGKAYTNKTIKQLVY